jgi:hypothetical protein
MEGFYRKSKDGSKRCSECTLCQKAKKRARYDPIKKRSNDILKKYGMTLEDYDSTLASQGGCAICGVKEAKYSNGNRFHIDHCHETGVVRGLLCGHCNVMLGHAKDNITTLQKAINYLQKHQ